MIRSSSAIIASVPASANDILCATISSKAKRGPRGGIYDPFPIKFHRMLDQIRDEGQESVVSWLSHGRAFKIHKPNVFASSIMPRFFNQSKYTSFQRQLNLYGFSRCCRGRDSGAYHHPFFLRGNLSAAKNIVRTKLKGNGHKTMRLHAEAEPDFYAMPPLTDDSQDYSTSDVSFIDSVPSMEQPRTSPTSAGCGPPNQASPSPTLSSDGIVTTNAGSPSPGIMTELSRRSSMNDEEGSASEFVSDLNQSIFIHELAMGCTILCQLRKGTNL